jgi:hypothetical protein
MVRSPCLCTALLQIIEAVSHVQRQVGLAPTTWKHGCAMSSSDSPEVGLGC